MTGVSAELRDAVATTGRRTFVATRRWTGQRWVAESEQAPGWSAAAHTPEYLMHLVTLAPAEVLGWPTGYAVLLHTDLPSPTVYPSGGTP